MVRDCDDGEVRLWILPARTEEVHRLDDDNVAAVDHGGDVVVIPALPVAGPVEFGFEVAE
jgi:hypothetical protein